jgi:hypothetical protein
MREKSPTRRQSQRPWLSRSCSEQHEPRQPRSWLIFDVSQEMKEPLRKAVSPDGKLTFGIVYDDEYCVGFLDQAWHTHGDILVPQYGPTAEAAAHAFFDSVIQDRQLICVSKENGKDERIWITDDPEIDVRYLQAGEILQVRFWSGKEVSCHGKKG